MRSNRAARALRAWATLLPLCLFAQVHGQSSAPAAEAGSPPFAAEPYYFKTYSDITSMHADGTGTRVQTFSVAVQSEASLHDFSVVSLLYASGSQHAEFAYARVVHPDGSVQETPVASAMDQPVQVTAQAPEYSDLKSKQLPIRSLRVGDTLEWQVRFVMDHPEAPNQFWGQDVFLRNVVVLDETYELHVPAGLHLSVWTNPRSGVRMEESDAPVEHIYRWHRVDTTPTVGVAAEAKKAAEAIRPRTADEELDDIKGSLPGFAWSTFPDYAAIGAWYRGLTADRIAPDAAIRAKVVELTAGKTTQLEKAQAVYNYVSNEIHYIGVDFGIGRYQPHTAAEVFANQYGDCKDKHTLLASMLSVLGIQADPVLIGAGIRFNPAIASAAAFNHLITHLTLDGKEVWLDATAGMAPWQSLLNVLRDKEALVIPAASPAVIRQTQKDLPYPQTGSMTVVGSLDKDLTSDSTIRLTLRDDDELYVRLALREVSPANYGEFVQRLMAGMGFGGTTSEAEIDHLDDPSQSLQISFRYHRVKEKDWGKDRITATFENIDAPAFSPDRPPVEEIQLGAPRTETSSVKMKLPQGWSAELPEDVHAHSAFANCDVTYSVANGILTAERRYTVLESKVPLKDAKQYLAWYDDAGAGGVPYIQLHPAPIADTALTKPAPQAPLVAAGAQPGSDPKAAGLVADAIRSLQQMDLDTGRKDLDEAAKINPTQANLWFGYAMEAQLLGKTTEIMTDLKREVTYHPEETRYYAPISEHQLRLGDEAGAIETLRAWEKAAPDEPNPPTRLVAMLIEEKHYSQAMSEGWEAIGRLQGSHGDLTLLRIQIATAQTSMGQGKEAAAAVLPLLKTTTDPILLNNITYVLAEAGANLQEAYSTQASVVAKTEADSAAIGLSTPAGDAAKKAATLAAQWDTLGWILYRQGKLEDAFAYCLAARYVDDNPTLREHVTAIAAAMHKPSANALARRSDLELRTIHLGAANGRHGVAPVTLVLAAGKIVDLRLDAGEGSAPRLAGADTLLAKADVRGMVPAGSPARILRTAFLNCSGSSCDLILVPNDSQRSVTVQVR